jgi:hypothetical protein
MKTSFKKSFAIAALGLAGSVFAVNSQAAVIDVAGSAGINNDGVLMSAECVNDWVTCQSFPESHYQCNKYFM